MCGFESTFKKKFRKFTPTTTSVIPLVTCTCKEDTICQ